MKKLRSNETGFSAIELVLVIVIVVLIGISGWLVYKNHHKSTLASTVSSTSTSKTSTKTTTTTKPDTTAPTVTNPYVGWATCNDTSDNITFKYPSNWTQSATVAGCGTNSVPAGGEGWSLTSPVISNIPYVYLLNYNTCPAPAGADLGTQTVLDVTQLKINPNTPQLYVVAYTDNYTNSTNAYSLALTQQKYTTGETVSYVNSCIQMGSGDNAFYYEMSAYLTNSSQQFANNDSYTLSNYLNQPDYNNIIKIFQSLSYITP
jgi:hypothetical protein